MQHLLKILILLVLGLAPQENQAFQKLSDYVPEPIIQQVQQKLIEVVENDLEHTNDNNPTSDEHNSQEQSNQSNSEKDKPDAEKIRIYNTTSGKIIERVTARAVEKSPVLINCTDTDLCDKPKLTPSPSLQPSPIPFPEPLPSPFPTIVIKPTITPWPHLGCPPPPYPPIPYGGKYELQRPMVCMY